MPLPPLGLSTTDIGDATSGPITQTFGGVGGSPLRSKAPDILMLALIAAAVLAALYLTRKGR